MEQIRYNERRRNLRDANECQVEPCCNLVAVLNGSHHAVKYLYDFSISGTGIAHLHGVATDTPMKLLFRKNGFVVSVKGWIAWCEKYGQSYRIGVEFDECDDNLIHFYLAVWVHLYEAGGPQLN